MTAAHPSGGFGVTTSVIGEFEGGVGIQGGQRPGNNLFFQVLR